MPKRNIPERNDDEFAGLERQLAQFAPHRSHVDRDTLMYRAGQESMLARPRQPSPASWLWPLTTAALTIVSIGLGWQLYTGGEPSAVERSRIVERSEATRQAEPPREREHDTELRSVDAGPAHLRTTQPITRSHYLRQRELALTVGMDAVTSPVAFPAQEAAGVSSYRELRAAYTESSRGGEKKSERESMSYGRFPGGQS